MVAAILVYIPLVLFPPPQPPSDCLLEVLRPQAIEERTLADFDRRVQDYVALYRRLAAGMPPAEVFDDEGGFFADELRLTLVAARPGARQGDFFTDPIADALMKRIDVALLYGVGGVGAPLFDPLLWEPTPRINEPFPAVHGAVQWPALVADLPVLPPELRYAFWGRDLLLVDVTANLVLDVLPSALPEGAGPGVIYP